MKPVFFKPWAWLNGVLGFAGRGSLRISRGVFLWIGILLLCVFLPHEGVTKPKKKPKRDYFKIDHTLTEIYEESLIQTFNVVGSGGIGSSACEDWLARPQQDDSAGSSIPAKEIGDEGEVLNPINTADMVLDKIINMGQKVWQVVANGQPVSQFKSAVATAIPQGARCWWDLEGWWEPRSRLVSVTFKNVYRWEVVKLTYRIIWLPGGQVRNRGRYVGYATVQPVSVKVRWGFHLNVEVHVPTVFNQGTADDPIGAMLLQVNYRVSSLLNVVDQGQAFHVNGLGQFKRLP
ncbi:MAG: hypothetical protein NZ480_06835 [Bdellovibrionaceae bacterium]|nr:hypothetical protein [Pseudobdellovibrionaceae bacterium]MDW8190315.1 hypothetical protein [Pseudobdellovibrionaceae bacterium]